MKKFDYQIIDSETGIVFDADKYTVEEACDIATQELYSQDPNLLITYDWMRYEITGRGQGGYLFCDKDDINAFKVIRIQNEIIYD